MIMVEWLPLPLSLAPWSGGTWDAALMGPISELNEQLLESMRTMAIAHEAADESGGHGAPRLVQLTQELWQRCDAGAVRRLSVSPYLLLDLGFAQQGQWHSLRPEGVMDQGARDSYFRGAAGIALLRRTLHLAWHVARSNRFMAGVVLGMHPAVAACLAAKGLKELEGLAELAPSWMVPRWERQPLVWRQMIQAACTGQPSALRAVYMRGWQLLARDRYAIC
jgi:hypothetical protein